MALLLGGPMVSLPWRGVEAAERPWPVVDLHVDLPYRHLHKGKPFAHGLGQVRASELEAAGVLGLVLPLFVPEWASPEGARRDDYERAYQVTFQNILETPPYSLPGCGVRNAGPGASRAVQTWFAFEGAAHLSPDPREIAEWMVRGVRIFGLVHTSHNTLATSSGQPVSRGRGLTPRGREVVKVLFSLGGVVDISHASDEATDEILTLAVQERGTVVATHSNARALAAHPRNLTDAQLRAIGQSGGVIGINFHQPFLSADGRANLKHVVDQIRYVIRVAGLDHVALGSDFEGGIRPVSELRDVTRYRVLAEALGKSGLNDVEIRKVMADNALRVLCGANSKR